MENQPEKKEQEIIIIGAGIAGLAAAIRMASKGCKVQIFEANGYAGGKMFEWRNEGFRFDMGPSVFTMPQYVEELFEIAGRQPKDYIEIMRPELPFNYFYDDGLMLHFYSDLEKLIQELVAKTQDDEATIRRFLSDIQTKFELTNKVFLHNSLHILSNYLTKDVLKGIIHFRKVEVFRSMDEANKRHFRDEHTVRLFNSFASYMGSNPFKAPGVLNVISHFQLSAGVFLPVGGMFSIAKALLKLALELGVEVHYNAPVERILVHNDKATGITVNGTDIKSDLVISNIDVYNTYRRLMPLQKAPTLVLERPKSHSAMVFLWGMKKTFPQLALHNMFLSNDMKSEYNTVFYNADVGDDFTIYLYISSKCIPDDAPEGCENWYILINVPHNQNQDWDKVTQKVRTRLLQRLQLILGEDIEPHIAFEKIQDPRTHELQTGAAFGAIYGNNLNGKFSVFMRHPNFSNRIKNLYFCGGTVHPGAGVPLSFLSAKIVADLIGKKSKRETHAGVG